MIWAIVSSQSCFCWLYRDSASLAAKNIINLILILTIWWCPHVESSLVLLEKCVFCDGVLSWQNSVSLCLASFGTPWPNFPVTPGISWLPTFAFYPLWWKGYLFGVSYRRSVGHYRIIQLQLLQHFWLGHRLGLLWYWVVCLGNELRSFCRFWDCIQVLHFGLFY